MSFLFPSLFSRYSFFVDKFFDILFLSFFVGTYPLFSAIGRDDESCKRAYGKSHVHPNISSPPALVGPWQNNERENEMERKIAAKPRETRQKTYWTVKGFFGGSLLNWHGRLTLNCSEWSWNDHDPAVPDSATLINRAIDSGWKANDYLNQSTMHIHCNIIISLFFI